MGQTLNVLQTLANAVKQQINTSPCNVDLTEPTLVC